MGIELKPEYRTMVARKVASGRYDSEADVLEQALRLLDFRDQEREEKLEWLRRAWQEGIESGPGKPLDFNELKRRARKEFEKSRAS